MNAVTLRHLSIGKVLSDIDFEVPAGACAGIVGVNGAGKSTLLGCCAGVLHPEKGSVQGTETAAYLPEGASLDPGIPVKRWLEMARYLPGWEPAFADKMLADFDLPRTLPVDRLSLGQHVRFGVLLTLGRKAPVYLLDDPFLGLDPVVRGHVESAIAARGAESTMLIAAQALEPLERLCTHLLLLDRGKQRVFDSIEGWQARFCALQTEKDVGAALRDDPAVLAWELRGRRARWVLDDPVGAFEKQLREAGPCEPGALPLEEVIAKLVERG